MQDMNDKKILCETKSGDLGLMLMQELSYLCIQSPKMSQYVVKCPEIDNCMLTKTSDADLILTPYPYHQICMLNDPKCCQMSQNKKSCVKLKLEMPILF